jgi:nucleotide sugar dehydrogenase
MTRKVVIIGQGYVGLPIAMRAVEVGYRVVGLDNDPARIERLSRGDSFVEDVSSKSLGEALATGRYEASADYSSASDFDVAIITVPTPLRESMPDLSYIESAAKSLAPHVRPGCLVVLESTTYPGTTEELLVPALETGSGLRAGSEFSVGYSPERIDPGNTTWRFENTPKVVSGIDPESLRRVADFYGSLVEQVVPVRGCKEAELTKLLENTFRHVNIALVNELAIFAHQLDIDVWNSIDAASTKPFGFMRFTPGPGVGGHCLPIDPSYLSWKVKQTLGHQFRFVDLANDVNEHMPDYTVSRITLALNRQSRAIRGSRILLVGLAYKPNSSDARESPSVRVAQLLTELGAIVHAEDPMITAVPRGAEAVTLVDSERLRYTDYDVVVILTDHDNVDYSRIASEARLVFDARRRMPEGHNIEHL